MTKADLVEVVAKTGEKVEVPAKRVPYFKPSKELKDLINEDGTSGSSMSASNPD